VFFCTVQAVFLRVGPCSLQNSVGKSSEAEKIAEYLNDFPSVSAQSESVVFQQAERRNQAVIKQNLGQDVSTSIFKFGSMPCLIRQGLS
jgi:hypothetical protein